MSVLTVWMRWDAVYYSRIAAQGYSATDGSTNFHPLLSWLATPLTRAGLDPIISLLIITSIATVLLYFVFYRLTLEDQDPATAKTSTLLFILWPISFVLYLPYTEPVWLLCAVAALLFARRARWLASAVAAALATLTRQQGLFLLVPLAWELWVAANCSTSGIRSRWRNVLSLCLIPLSYLGWICYRIFVVGDAKPDTSSLSKFVGSVLLSPARYQVVKDNQFIWPWKAAYFAVKRAMELPFLNPWMDLLFGLIFLILVTLAWRHIRMSYRLYVLVIVVVSFSFHTGMTPTGGAYLSLPRHLLLAFPVFIGLGARWPKFPTTILWVVSIPLMTLFLFGYFWMRLVP